MDRSDALDGCSSRADRRRNMREKGIDVGQNVEPADRALANLVGNGLG
jgi:hypothetical protein